MHGANARCARTSGVTRVLAHRAAVDSFSSLRADQQMIRHSMQTTCFICGIDRFTLDTKGGGFEHHSIAATPTLAFPMRR